MKLSAPLATLAILAISTSAAAYKYYFTVVAREYDPHRTDLVASGWMNGIGCPTDARLSNGTHFTAGACPTGDSKDFDNEGLILAKTGPTTNNASAIADIYYVRGRKIEQLGYDIRKPGPTVNDPRGSHCDNGSPRFNVTLKEDNKLYFIGCRSPLPSTQVAGDGWLRLTWGGGTNPVLAFPQLPPNNVPVDIKGKTIKELQIVFDDGQDVGPDNFGLAVLDNINVNGTRIGKGNPGNGLRFDEDDEDDDAESVSFLNFFGLGGESSAEAE